MDNYSVLMSVYYKEKPDFLEMSIQSMIDQTIPPNDIVIVCDGKLTDKLYEVINNYKDLHDDIFTIVQLNENKGQGIALRIGIEYCKNSFIARMDSDDISFPNRCEIQLKYLRNGIDIVSAAVEEFSGDISNITGVRSLPENHEEIIKFSKHRNPFNHPCIMFRKEAVIKAGNYQEFYLYEDYYLWIRMIYSGAIGYNVQDPLLFMRAGSEMYKRRGGYKYFRSSVKFQRYLYKNQIIGKPTYIYNLFIRFCVQVMVPNNLRGKIFGTFMRNRADNVI